MTDRLINALKFHSGGMDGAIALPRMGVVQSYDPTNGTARVMIQPEGVLSGWLPVASQWIGSGWGVHAPLMGGEQVLVTPLEGDAESGVIAGRVWSDHMLPPANTPAGEVWIQHQTGSFIKMENGGAIYCKDQFGASAKISDGTVVLQDEKGATATLTGGRIVLQDVSGSLLHLSNDHNITAKTTTFNVLGNVSVSGQVFATQDIISDAVSLQLHVHLDPDTAPPHSTTAPVGSTGGSGSVPSPALAPSAAATIPDPAPAPSAAATIPDPAPAPTPSPTGSPLATQDYVNQALISALAALGLVTDSTTA